jgi:RimJ/RimL family protein N-acetyltransferase
MYPYLTRDEVFMIGTRRLWLRWSQAADAERLAAIGGHPTVAAQTATWPVGCDAALARERIISHRARNASGAALTLVIVERHQWSRAIGLIGISVSDDGRTGTLGYHLDPHHWGRGYMSEAIGGIVSMTRLITRIERVRAGVMPHNLASMRVLEKNGFVRGAASVFQSPIKGPIEVIDFERVLRAPQVMPSMPRALAAVA